MGVPEMGKPKKIAAVALPAWLAAAGACGQPSAAEPGRLRIEALERRLLEAAGAGAAHFRLAPGGAVWALDRGQAALYRYAPGRSEPARVRLAERFPQFRETGVNLLPGFAVDGAGRALVPAVWFRPGRRFTAAVFVVEPGSGGLAVMLPPPVEIRHVALGEEGTFYVLGTDAGYFRGTAAECNLVHWYSAEGERLASFSRCPESPPGAPAGALLQRLNRETESGRLWTRAGLVYHVLPLSRQLRVFRRDGTPVRRAWLQPPVQEPAAGGTPFFATEQFSDQVQRIVPIANGGFLIQWLASQRQGAGRRNFPYLALHNAAGEAISRPRPLPWKRSALAFSDEEGRCYFLRWISPERYELIRTTASLE